MADQILSRFENVVTWVGGSQRAPHKPLLVLLALGEWTRGVKAIRFSDVVETLADLLRRFGPARKVYHPEYPFWRLQRDGVWEVHGVCEIAVGKDGSATRGSLLAAGAVGRFTEDIRSGLSSHPGLISKLARQLLETHFPASLHEDILEAVGLELDPPRPSGGGRDPDFRKRVLTAYQYQCAVCGFQVLLSGWAIALEAAHIRWHQAGGPATVSNGLCLCTLHHKLYDLGAFGVRPDHAVVVSDEVAGTVGLSDNLLAYHCRPLRRPIREADAPADAYLLWHLREVFRGESRPTTSEYST